MSGTTKPKKRCMLQLSNSTDTATVYITLYPQQIWFYKMDGDKVHLKYNHTDLLIPESEFEKFWKVVE